MVLSLFDIFQSVIVPRAVGRTFRLSAYLARASWAAWLAVAFRFRNDARREAMLATYAPFYLVLLLIFWVFFLIFGYGLIFYGLRGSLSPPDLPLAGTLYFAGTTLITVGFGDVTPKAADARAISILAGGTGFAVVGLVTAFLFSTFAAYQRREAFVVRVAALAGAPPTGVEILEGAAELGIRSSLANLFSRGQDWAADVLETHLAYPMLAYFRSNHDDQSWIATLGALLDAATLLIAAVDDASNGEARLMYRLGHHLAGDLDRYFALSGDAGAEIDREDFVEVLERLRRAGYRTAEPGAAWTEFCRLRAVYATPLGRLAKFWRVPAAMWIGDAAGAALNAHAPRGTV